MKSVDQSMKIKRAKSSRSRQPFLPGIKEPLREFGGSLLKNSHAKVKRPIACRRPMHVVLRSSRSRGTRSLLSPKRAGRIQGILHIQAERFQVKLMKIANAGNHLHLVVKAKTIEGFKGFLRAVTGAIAKFCRGLEAREMNAIESRERQAGGVVAAETKATGHDHGSDGQRAQKAEAKNLKAAGHELVSDGRSANQSSNIKEKFWDQRPFTKILEWGRMHRAALKYLTQNTLEALGFVSYQTRGMKLRRGRSGERPFETIVCSSSAFG